MNPVCLSVFNTDYTEMVMQIFQPFGEPSFALNFTGYDFRSIDWYKTYEAMAQSSDDAIAAVCDYRFKLVLFNNYFGEPLFINFYLDAEIRRY